MLERLTRTGLGLELRRLFFRRVSGNRCNLALVLVVQPMIIAIVVALSYLSRSKIDAFRDQFLYFSTLYAFWIGIFESCQAINGEVKSGEWSYWVLGFRRNRICHVGAVFTMNLMIACFQVLWFIVFLVACGFIGGLFDEWSIQSNFIDVFCSCKTGTLASPVFQMGGAARLWLGAKFGLMVGPLCFSMFLFWVALFMATLSGCGFGLLFSVWFKEPLASLNFSVGFVVLLGMLSYCGLRSVGSSKDSSDLVERAFLPRIERNAYVSACTNSVLPTSLVRFPVCVSGWFIPQRYFFNIARITGKRNLGRFVDAQVERAILRPYMDTMDGRRPPPWLRLGADGTSELYRPRIDLREGAVSWLGNGIIDQELEDEVVAKYHISEEDRYLDRHIPYLVVEYLRRHPENSRDWRVGKWCRVLIKGIIMEMLPILFMLVACLVISAAGLFWRKGIYEKLR